VAEGYDIGVLNGVIVRMKDELQITAFEVSLVVSITPLFVMLGGPLGSVLADAIGRRCALLWTCLLLGIGPLVMALAPSMPLLLLGRAGVGLGIGMGFVIVSMYVTEIAPAHMRGGLLTFEELMLNLGSLSGFGMNLLLLGVQNDWRIMLGAGAVLPLSLAAILACPGMPESPRWLCSRGRYEQAAVVLHKFLSASEADVALEAMKGQASQERSEVTWASFLLSKEPSVRRALITSLAVAVAQTSCGGFVVGYYSSVVLSGSMSEAAAFKATILIGLIKASVVMLVMLVLERVGRRPMMLTSTIGTALFSAWIACSFLLNWAPWLQVAGFCLFVASFSIGQGPVTWVYISEVFVTEVRAKGLGATLFASRVFGTLSTFSFPIIVESTSVAHAFVLQTIWNMCVVVVLWATVVESHGRTLEEMGTLFHDKVEA